MVTSIEIYNKYGLGNINIYTNYQEKWHIPKIFNYNKKYCLEYDKDKHVQSIEKILLKLKNSLTKQNMF